MKAVSAWTVAFLAALAVGCNSPKFSYQNSSLGVDVVGDKDPVNTTLPDGDEDISDSLQVNINGMGEHDVMVSDDAQPMAMGGKQTLTVVDMMMGQTRIFSYDPMANSITFSDGMNNLVVVQNPDKSYSINGMAAANGKAAVPLLKTSPVYSDGSAWSFIATYSNCESCLEIASSRNTVDCGTTGVHASTPAVCDIFRDLCDCVACDKLGMNPCSLCP